MWGMRASRSSRDWHCGNLRVPGGALGLNNYSYMNETFGSFKGPKDLSKDQDWIWDWTPVFHAYVISLRDIYPSSGSDRFRLMLIRPYLPSLITIPYQMVRLLLLYYANSKFCTSRSRRRITRARVILYSWVFCETKLLVRGSLWGLMNSPRNREGGRYLRLAPSLALPPVFPPCTSPNLHSGFTSLHPHLPPTLPWSNLYWLLYRTTALLL